MNNAPKKRDPKQKPLQGNPWATPRTSAPVEAPKEGTKIESTTSRFTTCKRCMGHGGMDGSCPQCGGTGFLD